MSLNARATASAYGVSESLGSASSAGAFNQRLAFKKEYGQILDAYKDQAKKHEEAVRSLQERCEIFQ